MSKIFYEFADKLIRSLDNRYNVVNMNTVLECISYFEQANVTKNFLEETRLGKYVNELRRSTKDESLAKRTRELVRKWRNQLIPEQTSANAVGTKSHYVDQNNLKVTTVNNNNNNYCLNNNKRLLNDEPQCESVKRIKRNGEFKTSSPELVQIDSNSDSYNLSPDLVVTNIISTSATVSIPTSSSAVTQDVPIRSPVMPHLPTELPSVPELCHTLAGTSSTAFSESGSSAADTAATTSATTTTVAATADGVNSAGGECGIDVEVITVEDDTRENKRNKKRYTRNRAKAITDAEASFNNKLVAMSRSKVKTTQEILVDLQVQTDNTNLNDIKKLDPPQAIAKLTEKIKKIDAKLKPPIQKQVNEIQRWRPNKNGRPTVIDIDSDDEGDADDVLIIDPPSPKPEPIVIDPQQILAQLPPIDFEQYYKDLEEDKLYACTCPLGQKSPDISLEENCPVKQYLTEKYNQPNVVTQEKLDRLHYENVEGLNGNYGRPVPPLDIYPKPILETDLIAKYNLYANVVPNVHTEVIPKRFPKYLPSIKRSNQLKVKAASQPLSDDVSVNEHDDRKISLMSDNDIDKNSSSVQSPILTPITTENDDQPVADKDCPTSTSIVSKEKTHTDYGDDDNHNDNDSAKDQSVASDKMSSSPNHLIEFIEYYKCVEVPSYNGEYLRILPYVVID